MNKGPYYHAFKPVAAFGLPIYRWKQDGYELFYAPGYLALVPGEQGDAFDKELGNGAAASSVAGKLQQYARQAQNKRVELTEDKFKPLCLTLYLHNECNLSCTYCFADPSPKPAERLDLPTIRSAARLVMDNCRAVGRPFTAVFHGGGEPTLHQPLLQEVLDMVEVMAQERNLPIFRYIASNGVISAARASWIAHRFDLVGLSCDGPPEINNEQRPAWAGGPSSSSIERTVRIIREEGTPLHVRVTITPQSMLRQSEIAAYICRTLQPQEIHVEPVYYGGRTDTSHAFAPEDARPFVAEFLRACETAAAYDIPWTTSSSRLQEIHGPYCHVFRDVLNLVPGGLATACFKENEESAVRDLGLATGRTHGRGFTLDIDNIQHLRQQLNVLPGKCASCFNQYHCARGCPTACLIQENGAANIFYCHVAAQISKARIEERAQEIWATRADDREIMGGVMAVR